MSNDESNAQGLLASSLAPAYFFAAAVLLAHLLTNGRYGYFRDELYFLACGEHLDWGYVDCAPLIALVAWLSRALLGDSLHAIRFFSAVASAGTVLLTGLIARELGGKRFAVGLACLCVVVPPVNLVLGTLLTMNVFEPLFWMGCAYCTLLVIKRDNPKYFLWFGVLAGLGLENKHSMLFFGFALVMGLLLTRDRRYFADKWIWIAGAIALALFMPNLIWQVQHNYPTLEDLSNVKRMHKNVELPPLAYIGQQIMMVLPTSLPVWAAGLWFFFFDSEGKRYRTLGWAFVILFSIMMVLKGKDYYSAPAYPMMFAAGGVFWERVLAAWSRLRWLKVVLPLLIVMMGAITLPFSLPILPVESLLRYGDAIGLKPAKAEVAHEGVLPQYYGDQFGWPELVAAVAKTYQALPPEQRAKAAILAGNYGEAGAIDFFGHQYGLPKAISGHQNYFFWGPRQYTGEVLITIQYSREWTAAHCQSTENGPTLNHPYAMAEEHLTILICRGLNQSLQTEWSRRKHWN
jgi:dolichyl-phosphate-mannose-protein mannosyltransferase